jgi:hypothetical protein
LAEGIIAITRRALMQQRPRPNNAQRHVRVRLTNNDRWFFIQLYRWFPSILKVLTVVRPETLVRWHRAGFRSYWRWKSRSRGGRPQIESDLRALIRRMSIENPLWGAPRIHGELVKLGFDVAQSSVAKYMVTSSGIAIASMAMSLCAEFAPWAYGTNLLHQGPLGRTVLPNG